MSSLRAEALAERFAPMTLEELERNSALRERVDRKYIVRWGTFETFAERLVDSHRVLEVDGLRIFTYDTTYFDTGSLRSYRDHVMQRRKRFKARSRRYVESGSCQFEVKLKGPRGETIKHRLARVGEQHGALDPLAGEFLQAALTQQYGETEVEPLGPTLHTNYRRMTLVATEGGQKLTCDFDLRVLATSGRGGSLIPRHVIVESKAERAGGEFDHLLHSLGARPVSCSKYCLGIAMTHDEVKANAFRSLLQRYFTATQPPGATSATK